MVARRDRWTRLLPVVLVVLVVSGCAATGSRDVERVASDFGATVARGDARAGCALLAASTREAMGTRFGAPCEQALPRMSLPTGPVTDSAVWGAAAQVRTRVDTLFLIDTRSGWRISAAGCRSRGDAPYDCRISTP